jgi:hypothetical protein
MEELRVKDIKNREVVYGCAFNIDFDRNSWYGGQVVHNICKPVNGIVNKWNEQDDYPNGQFYILKTDGSPESSVQFQLIPGTLLEHMRIV